MPETKLEKEIARIIDPTAYWMRPTTYGLSTEKEMLDKTMVGPIRAVALDKARRILEVIRRLEQPVTHPSKT